MIELHNNPEYKELIDKSNQEYSKLNSKDKLNITSNSKIKSNKKLSTSSILNLSNEADNTQIIESRLKMSTIEEEEINEDNIWNYSIINVISSTVCLVSVFLIETINLSFVGYTKDSETNLSSVGVGNILLNFTSLFVAFGGLGALDTVGSFCFGKNDYIGLSLAIMRMRFLISLIFLLLTIPTCMFAGNLLIILGINYEVAKRAGEYCFYMLPAIFFAFNFNLSVRVLQVMHDYFYVSVISILGVIFHYLVNFVAFNYYNIDNYIVVAHISSITMLLMNVMLIIYMISFNPNNKHIKLFDIDMFNTKELWVFSKLAIFSALQHYGDFIGYEIVAFLGNYLPVHADNAASLVILNYTVVSGYVYSGSSYPLGQIIGYSLGKEDKKFYKFAINTYIKLNLIISVFLTAFTSFFKYDILYFYTKNEVIINIAAPILQIYAFFIPVDCYNVMFQSILRGSGNQDIPSIWNIIATLSITIPVSYVLAFVVNIGMLGLWIGIFSFMTIMLIISFFYVYYLDFQKESDRLTKELNIVNELITESNQQYSLLEDLKPTN